MLRASQLFTVGAALALLPSLGGLTAQETAPDTVLLTGSSLGGVRYTHAAHQALTECGTCHHESRAQMPLASPHQACTDCHTSTPTAPMVTSVRDALHDAAAKKGTCIDCHTQQAAAGKSPPLTCTQCHKRENRVGS